MGEREPISYLKWERKGYQSEEEEEEEEEEYVDCLDPLVGPFVNMVMIKKTCQDHPHTNTLT